MQAQDMKVLGSPCSMNTNKASWQANDNRQVRNLVVIEEDQDGDPGLRTSP